MNEDHGGTMTLTEFLYARIAEDEAAIYAPAEWKQHVLAECDAKRRIVALHETVHNIPTNTTFCVVCGIDQAAKVIFGQFPCQTLRLLALPYADHPDYRDEWRP